MFCPINLRPLKRMNEQPDGRTKGFHFGKSFRIILGPYIKSKSFSKQGEYAKQTSTRGDWTNLMIGSGFVNEQNYNTNDNEDGTGFQNMIY